MLSRLSRYARRLDEALHERLLGIHTSEWHTQYDALAPEHRGYAPTSYRDWRVIRRHLPVGGTFLDYGAGLGRVLALAARSSFDRVIGVEFDKELVRRAQQNLRAARGLRCPAEIVHADAASFQVPDTVLVAMFCNPFTGSILQGALDRLRESLRRAPRDLQILCNVPERSAFEDDMALAAWLKMTETLPLSDGRKCLMFMPYQLP